MELYLQREFLDNFYIQFDESNPEHQIVKNIIVSYGDKKVFIDYEEHEFLEIIEENEFFELICNTSSPIPVANFLKAIESSKFHQTIVFANNKQDWFNDIEKQGALCFSFHNFESKIKSIVNKLHFRIDLSEELKDWNFLDNYSELNYNAIAISDNYVLVDKAGQKIEDNIVQILDYLFRTLCSPVKVDIYTLELNPLKSGTKYIIEKAKKRLSTLNRLLAKHKKSFKIFSTKFDKQFGIDLHDRLILTNFSILESGKGFNLIPHRPSNSQIISETIFDKYTYKRLGNIKKLQEDYKKRLCKADTVEFKGYPIA